MSTRTPSLGFLQTTSLVTGNLVGSGVFLLPAALAIFGNISLIAWLLTGLGALMLAFIFAKLSQTHTKNGGPHHFIMQAFGPQWGYWTAWGYWILSWVSNAALIVAAVSYASIIFGGFSGVQTLILELVILASITGINLIGVQTAGRFEFIMTTLKLIPLVIIPAVGLIYIDWSSLSFSMPQNITLFTGLNSAMFLTIWGFIGLETATVTSGEVKNAQKIVPIATMIGTSIALLVYIVGSFVMLNLLGSQQLAQSSAPYADLAGQLFGGNWSIIIALSALICCLGSFNGWTMVVGRIAQGAANDGLFPSIFAQTTSQGTPRFSILVSSLCTLPILLLSVGDGLVEQFNNIVDISVTLILFVYGMCILAFLKLHPKNQSIAQYIPVCGAAFFVLFSLYAAGIKMMVLSLIFLALGVPMWLWMNRKSSTQVAMS